MLKPLFLCLDKNHKSCTTLVSLSGWVVSSWVYKIFRQTFVYWVIAIFSVKPQDLETTSKKDLAKKATPKHVIKTCLWFPFINYQQNIVVKPNNTFFRSKPQNQFEEKGEEMS